MAQSSAPTAKAPQGFWAFGIIWFGQLISLIGSGLTTFGLGVWAYQRTGSVTLFAMITLAGTLPSILVAPIAGTLVDRWSRHRVLIFCDLGLGLVTSALALLLWNDMLIFAAIYIIVALKSLIKAFQMPAYNASISLMIPKEHLSRASGMMQFGGAAAQILAPFLAGFLLRLIGLEGIVLIDMISFFIAVGTLLIVRIPSPPRKPAAAKRSVLADAKEGLSYITQRPGLLGILIFFAIVNFAFGIAQVLFTPLVLKFSTPAWLGTISAMGGLGILVGSLVLTAWGGPRPRIYGVLGFGLVFGLALSLAGAAPINIVVAIASFASMFCAPFIDGCSLAIWQTKIPAEMQGRVFSTRLMIAWSSAPFAYIIAGPLADRVFEPMFMPGGALAGSIGQIIGTGPGRGIGFIFVLLGLIPVLAALWGYFYAPVRLVEQQVPDAPKPAPAAPAPAATPAPDAGDKSVAAAT